jgi:hypothetical protein
LDRWSIASGPITKAVQWCRASWWRRRTVSITARAAASSSTRTTSARKRERLTSISTEAEREIVRYAVRSCGA